VIVKFAFADDRLALDLRGFKVRALSPSAPAARDAGGLAGAALDAPLAGPPFADLARGRRKVTIIVPDATRRASLPQILPTILDRLERAGVDLTSITVLVANGTHPAVGPKGLAQLLGPLPTAVEVLEHDSRSPDLVAVGELRRGVPVRLHPSAVECDFLVTIGTVRHHYFAGFGGGPKMVFPGVGGYEEIQANHSLVLEMGGDQVVRHPKCEPGNLRDNPVAEEIRRVAELRPADVALCLVEGRDGGVAWAGAGPWVSAFESAIDKVREWFEIPNQSAFRLMVACGGGFPTDSTLIQAHKSLDAACRFLEPGGELLWVASLEAGLGSQDMAQFVADPQVDRILTMLGKDWVQYGHTTLRIVEKTARHRVQLVSDLAADVGERLGFEPISDPMTVIGRWRERFPGERVGAMVSGAVFPRA
jgi:nickel-dependent lactate racemase